MRTLDHRRRSLLRLALASPVAVALPALGQAPAFPTRPIRLICPWPPGGSSDAVMRAVAESAGRTLGGQLIVENKAGAGGMLGPNELVTAKPDGYKLSQIVSGVVRLPHMQKMAFDPLKDFTYIVCLTGYTFGLVVRADSPIKSIQDLVAFAKAHPETFTYGSPGIGSTPHLAVEEFASKAAVKLQHIPFKGFTDGLQALLGGHVMAHSDSTGWAPQVDAGSCRLLATYGPKRTKRWSSVPTLQELGYETVSESPWGIGGPRDIEPAITKQLHDAFKKSLEDPTVLASFEKYEQPVIYMNTEDYTRFQREQYVKERAVIERLGLMLKA